VPVVLFDTKIHPGIFVADDSHFQKVEGPNLNCPGQGPSSTGKGR